MKVALLGDTHFIYKKNSKLFKEYFEKFYTDIFFPYLLRNNIRVVIQSGDLFDDRKNTNNGGFAECKKFFFDTLKQYNITLYTIIGNHDIFYKNTLSVNSPSLWLGNEYDNVYIIDRPAEVIALDMLFVPWLCDDNTIACLEKIASSHMNYCMGHFEIKNFSMYKGIECKEGLESNIFRKYSKVFSGHFHHKSNKNNIYYLGTPYQMTSHDANDERGFYIFDTITGDMEFIENPYTMFNIIEYSDDICFSELSKYENTYVKVIVNERTEKFEVFLDHLNNINPYDVSVIEKNTEIELNEVDVDETESTLNIIMGYINNVKNKDIDNKILSDKMESLYLEALHIENT